MPKIPMAIRIDSDVKAKIEAQAAAENRSVTNLIETVMDAYCSGKIAASQAPARRRKPHSD